MKRLLALVVLLLSTAAFAQWTQLPHAAGSFGTTRPGARPRFSGYNRAVYDPFVHATFSRDRINSCGDPFTNSDWWWFTSTNSFQNVGWSGGGQLVNNVCAAPPTEPDPITDGVSEPGDRHPFHQYGTDRVGHVYLTGGVEDNTKCDDSGSGICNYKDFWRFDDATQAWTQLASLTFSPSEGALEPAPWVNKVYLFGGIISGNAVNALTQYDVATNTWTRLTPAGPQPPLSDGGGMVADPDDNLMVIWGGHACVTCAPTAANAQFYLYDPATNSYTKPALSQLPPVDVFPKMDWDSRRHEVVLYVAGSGVWTYVPSTGVVTHLAISGGPPLYNGIRNSLTMTYDSDRDLHLVHAYGCNCYWEAQLP